MTTNFPRGPELSGFLDDLLCVFRNNPDRIELDAELIGYFREALSEAIEKARLLEAYAGLKPAERRTPVERRQLARSAINCGRITVFPLAVACGALAVVNDGSPDPGGAA